MHCAKNRYESEHARRLAGSVDIWIAPNANLHNKELLRRCREQLTPDEWTACASFHQEADQRRAVITRALVRTALSHYFPVDAMSWRFERGVHGRPEIAFPAGSGLRFNLSHTREAVVCAVTLNADIGIDVERFTSNRDLPAIAATVCSAGELRALRNLAPDADVYAAHLLTLWTLKEAYLKARGTGFTLSPRNLTFNLGVDAKVSVSFSPDAPDDPDQWWLATLDHGDSHLLSIAMRHDRGYPLHCSLFKTDLSSGCVQPLPPRYLRISGNTAPPWLDGNPRSPLASGC